MNRADPLYQRDPDAWRAHLAEGNAKQPRKRVGADALIHDSDGRILLVNPNYKPDWDLPGGMSDANEPPDATVRRELAEELGLNLPATPLSLLCIDWVAPHGPWDDSLMLIFDAGTLSPATISTLHIADHELEDFGFFTPDQARQRLRAYIWQRLQAALHARTTGHTAYLHDGKSTSVQ
ncbi:NUDIX hydrolase [Nocardia fluminea]|uniref:NUDIX hydrolase n=1 Tax=Nocardia fluminea TaxID=134984 RepID=UPI0033E7AEA7